MRILRDSITAGNSDLEGTVSFMTENCATTIETGIIKDRQKMNIPTDDAKDRVYTLSSEDAAIDNLNAEFSRIVVVSDPNIVARYRAKVLDLCLLVLEEVSIDEEEDRVFPRSSDFVKPYSFKEMTELRHSKKLYVTAN
jgi:hypothetical protein